MIPSTQSTHSGFFFVNRVLRLLIIGYYSVTNDGPSFFFHTNKDASQYKLISVDVSAEKPVPAVVIPEQKDALLCDVQRVNKDRFVIQYKRNVGLCSVFALLSEFDGHFPGQRRTLYL